MKSIRIDRMMMRQIYKASGLKLDPHMFTGKPIIEPPYDYSVWCEIHWMEMRVWNNHIMRVKLPLLRDRALYENIEKHD